MGRVSLEMRRYKLRKWKTWNGRWNVIAELREEENLQDERDTSTAGKSIGINGKVVLCGDHQEQRMKEQIWSLGGSGIPMTFVDLGYQPLTWTNVVSMETGLRIGLQRGWVVDGVADTSWITALDQSMEFRHLGPWIRTQRQGGEMIWNSIGLYFFGRFGIG